MQRYWERKMALLVEHAAADDADTFAWFAELLDATARTGMAGAAAALTTRTPDNPRPFSWGELGRALGVSRQAAHKRYGRV